MPRDGGNGNKGKIINALKYENLVLVYVGGLKYPYIGLKFGNREIRKPFVFIFGQAAEDPREPTPSGNIAYGLLPVPFLEDGDSIFVEGAYVWHPMRNEDVQNAYRGLISPIIQP